MSWPHGIARMQRFYGSSIAERGNDMPLLPLRTAHIPCRSDAFAFAGQSRSLRSARKGIPSPDSSLISKAAKRKAQKARAWAKEVKPWFSGVSSYKTIATSIPGYPMSATSTSLTEAENATRDSTGYCFKDRQSLVRILEPSGPMWEKSIPQLAFIGHALLRYIIVDDWFKTGRTIRKWGSTIWTPTPTNASTL